MKAEFHPEWILHKKDTEQSHVFLTFPGVALDSPLRHAIALFTEITGGGASSRLYLKIRESWGSYTTPMHTTPLISAAAHSVCGRRSLTEIKKDLLRRRLKSLTI